MTSVSAPTTGTVSKGRSQGFGPIVGAVALVLAAGAAIATGIAVNSGDTTPAAESVYLNDLEALRHTSPGEAQAAAADEVLRGKVSGQSAPDLTTYEGLVAAGIIPSAYEATTPAPAVTESPMFGNPELDHFRSINEIPEPTPAPFVEQPGQPR